MKIQLITPEQHAVINKAFTENKALVFQNNSYEYLDKSKLSEVDLLKFKEIEDVLKASIFGFRKFSNLKLSKAGDKRLRFQYNWNYDEPDKPSYEGVGYINLDELLNGFAN